MAKAAIDFSKPLEELLGGGGSIFNDGIYRVEKARFCFFDFKKPGNDSLCFMLELQPMVDGKAEGDVAEPRYWAVGDKIQGNKDIMVEPVGPVKGEKGSFSQIRLTESNTHDKLFAFSDFGYFLTAAVKAEVDMDAIGNDITSLDGQVFEFGKMLKTPKKKTAVQVAEDGDDETGEESKKKYPAEVVIITGVPKKSKAAAGKKAKEETDEAPKGKAKSKAKGPEAILSVYLEENVGPEVKDGADYMSHRLALSRYLTKDLQLDADDTKAVMAIYNDKEEKLPALLTTLGWKYNGKTKEIEKAEE